MNHLGKPRSRPDPKLSAGGAWLEYAWVYLPAQQNAVLESVGKSLPAAYAKALGIEQASPVPPAIVPHVTLEAIEQALARTRQRIDLNALLEECIDKARGRV
jgi:hypothetical protein